MATTQNGRPLKDNSKKKPYEKESQDKKKREGRPKQVFVDGQWEKQVFVNGQGEITQ